MSYHQLTQSKRTELAALLRVGLSQRQAAIQISCHQTTVSRELRRHA